MRGRFLLQTFVTYFERNSMDRNYYAVRIQDGALFPSVAMGCHANLPPTSESDAQWQQIAIVTVLVVLMRWAFDGLPEHRVTPI